MHSRNGHVARYGARNAARNAPVQLMHLTRVARNRFSGPVTRYERVTRPVTGPAGEVYDHASGRGFVDFHPGDYYDALRRKNNQVVLLLVEVFGGLAGGGARLLRFMSRRAKDKKRGRDGTKYSKFHPENYLSHHLSAISMAAVYADACHIDDGVTGLKQDAHAAGSSDEE